MHMFIVAGLQMLCSKEPVTFPDDNNNALDNLTMPSGTYASLLTTTAVRLNINRYSGIGTYGIAPFQTPGETEDAPKIIVKWGSKAKRLKKRRQMLPSVKKDVNGDVYVPPSYGSCRQHCRRRRRALPSVVRNSVGEVCLPTTIQRRRLYEPKPDANFVGVRESVLLQEIDEIYEMNSSDGGFARRPGAVVNERDQPIYQDNWVRLAV